MKYLKFLFFIVLTGIIFQSCHKDDNFSNELNGQSSTVSNLNGANNTALIQEVQDSVQSSYWQNLTTNAGTPLWNCAYTFYRETSTKVVVPYQNPHTSEVENLLIGFKSDNGHWKVKLVNLYYYQFLSKITDHYANHLFYKGILKEFQEVQTNCSGISVTSFNEKDEIKAHPRLEMIAIITFDDGTQWFVYSDGSIHVIPGGGGGDGSGCFGGTSGTITWSNGGTYNFPGDNNSGSNNGNPFNWNNSEDSGFGCSWCSNNDGGGGGSSSLPLCMQPNLWSKVEPEEKKDYINALSDIINLYDITTCNNPFASEEELEDCLSSTDLLCMGIENGCLSFINGEFQEGHFKECMREVLIIDDSVNPPTADDIERQFNYLNMILDLDDNEECLINNPTELSKIESFLDNHNVKDWDNECMQQGINSERNLSKAIANAYADAMCNDGITQLDLGSIGDPNDPIWDFMKEALLESIKELVADFIPGGTLATIGPELFSNLQGGEWMDAMYNAFDIVLNEADACFPVAKIASTGIGLYVKGKHLKKVYDAFKKAKALGEEFLLKLYNVFRNKLNWGVSTIRDKFQWLGGVNAKIDDFVGSEFFEKLKEEFGATYVFNGTNGHPVFKILTIPVNKSIYMELYPDANSGWNWTIEFSTGPENATSHSQLSSKYKIRFDN